MVEPGTYLENIDFSGKNITVRSSMGSAVTIIDGGALGPVVMFDQGESTSAVLDGFTIQNGVAADGGGVQCVGSSPTIVNNTITSNLATSEGGGISCRNGSSPLIAYNVITANTATSANLFFGSGGGIHCYVGSDATIVGNTIHGNSASYRGGGICIDANSTPIVENNFVFDNSARWGGGFAFQTSVTVNIAHNTVSDNTATEFGGGLFCRDSVSPTITNMVVWGNSSPTGAQIAIAGDAGPSSIAVEYSDVQGGQAAVHVGSGGTLNWLSGNIDSPPLFVAASDYHLTGSSPCIDQGLGVGTNTDVDGGVRPLDTGPDIGADEYCVGSNDVDGDGLSECEDCDEADPVTYRGAPEICDARDNNCDGYLADFERDQDSDGWALCAGDCDDGDPARSPGNAEICDNAIDDDCDQLVDGADPNCLPFSITSTLPSVLRVGELFSQQLETSNGQPPLVWSVATGALPPGITLSVGGLVSGTPTDAGLFTFTARVTDDTTDTAEKTFTIEILATGTFDLAAEWSDTSNPNGVWSYNGSPGVPIATHWDDWDPSSGCCFVQPQAAWAASQWPDSGHVPMWAKVVADALQGRDFPTGAVIMHGGQGSGPSPLAGVTWTSPVDDVITIAGGVWLVDITGFRNMNWTMYLNGSPLTSGSLTFETPYRSIAPFRFEDGSGGPGALTQTVSIGDVITLEFVKTSTFASFVGVDLTIFTDLDIVTPLPSALRLGEYYSRQLETVAGLPPFSWSVVSGTPPLGMDLDSDGLFSGMPTELGGSTFTVGVTDGTGGFAERTFVVDVVLVLPPPDIRVNKVATSPVPGRTIEYYIAVQNMGDTRATNVGTVDTLHHSLELQTVHSGGSEILPGFVAWTAPSLDPGGVEVYSYEAVISPGTPVGTNISTDVCSLVDWSEILQCIKDIELRPQCNTACMNSCKDCLVKCMKPPFDECQACIEECELCDAQCWEMLIQDIKDCFVGQHGCKLPRDFFIVIPVDPNEKCVAAETFIQPDQLLVYPIHFENIGEIEALDVFVTDILDPNLDASTLDILTPGGSYNSGSRTLAWNLLGINLQPEEAGTVLFSINPVSGLPSGSVIQNSAEIQFEIFDIISTRLCGSNLDAPQPVVNIIDTTPPTCVMDPLPSQTTSLDISIAWSGMDAIGQVDKHSIYVSVDGGVFVPFVLTGETSAIYSGRSATTYGFLCVAEDTAGNVEVQSLAPETTTQTCLSADGDSFCVAEDCDDADPTTFPGAPEVNDGVDNQCPGDPGFGIVDETSGDSGFLNPSDKNEYSWAAQSGATLYEVARSPQPDFTTACVSFTTSDTFLVDTTEPTPGGVFNYLNRPVAPSVGSWGQRSSGIERIFSCP
jgi:uncharacterized repeat protein (TIGR01451 family)